MPVPFAINGLGRVGRALLRIAAARADVELVAVNDLVAPEVLARLLRRDTVHGPFPGNVEAADGALLVDGRRIPLFRESDPAAIPWRPTGARLVVEATGELLARARAARHLDRSADPGEGRDGGVERVILTANAPDADVTLCLGVNESDYDPRRHRVVSNSSCTTNCLAPILRILHARFGVERALMTAVHSYTVNQRLLDLAHPDPRRSRAAAVNMVPTATTAPAAVGRLLPALAGRVEGIGVRVPTPAAAMLDLAVVLAAEAGVEQVRSAFRDAAAGELAGILATTDEELVSSDFIGDPHSAVVDLPLVQATGRLLRVVAWYDNEWGYANRLAELVARLGGEPAGEEIGR
jgi:glyceraldehyde 3-phosphate dehydrogenase (phosphorylating)